MTINSPEAQQASQEPESPSTAPEATKVDTGPEKDTQPVSDPLEALRAELANEYSERLVHAELRIQAAEAGVTIPEALLYVLNMPKLINADGNPNAVAIASIVATINKEPEYRQDLGLGRTNPFNHNRQVSLDARRR